MQLLHQVHNEGEFFSPISSLPGPKESVHSSIRPKFSQVERVFPATQIQRAIAAEGIQWAKAELSLWKKNPADFLAVFNAWTALASHHAALRSHLSTDPQTGELQVTILRRIGGITLQGMEKDEQDASFDRLAHMALEATEHADSIRMVLHFHRALLDAASISMIKLDFALLLHGIPCAEHTGFYLYTRYLEQWRKSDEGSKSFWSNVLSGAVPRLALQAAPKHAHGAGSLAAGGGGARRSISVVINGPNLADLGGSHLAESQGQPLSSQTVLELLWGLVLGAHTGSDEVVYGTVRRDSTFVGADSCVGCLDQTYLVRLPIPSRDRRLTVRDAVVGLERYHEQASHHAFVGLDEISRHLPANTSVETALTYTRLGNPPCLAPGMSRFPVVLAISGESSAALQVTLRYRDSYIASADAEVVLQHFVAAVRSAAAKVELANCLCSAVDLVSEDERDLLLAQSRSPRTAQPTTIPSLFEKAVKLHPQRTALEFEESVSLTYAELDGRANALARALKLQRGAIVPVLAERSPELIVALLAVLKSGAAYTVLDPDAPVQRNAQVVAECDPPFVLATRRHSRVFPNTTAIEDALASCADRSPLDGVSIGPQDRCYIIYTSGSTGKPKGAVLTHGAATSGMAHHSLGGLQRWLLFYNPIFSAAQRTMLATLVHGGTLVLASKERLTGDVAGTINSLRADVVGITPSALSLLRPADVPGLKQVTLVGESVPQHLVDVWAGVEGLTLRNTYGLSECTQLNFGRALLRSADDDDAVINPRVVGVPGDTSDAFVLLPGTTELAPRLVAGELCLAGPQLAEGYLNEPALTARAFVDNAFGPGRLYRTGDLARRLADGSVEILGRADLQVKINGQKVEPAEVDGLLLGCGAVDASVTLPVEVEEGRGPSLVAFVVLAGGRTLRQAVVAGREYLRERLPGYMIPTMWVPVEAIPKTASGKINLQQLRELARDMGAVGFAKAMFEGEAGSDTALEGLELEISKAWAAVLDMDPSVIRKHHSLLDLGGTSIQAIKIISELRLSGLALDFSELLAGATLESIASAAQVIDKGQDEIPQPFSLVQDNPRLLSKLEKDVGISDAYPATPFQAAMLTSLNTPSDPYTYSRTWDVSGLDTDKLRESFEQVFRARAILRTGFVPHKRSFVQVVRDDVPLPWHESQETLDSFVADKSHAKWDMSEPLFRVTLLGGAQASKVLVVTMHHSLFDFWSHRFLYRDVAAAYQGKAMPVRTPFSAFVRHVVLGQQPDAAAASRDFWAGYLAGAPTTTLNYAPVNSVDQAVKLKATLDFSLSQRARECGVTLGGVVYGAWAVLLSHHAAASDVVYATTVSGREAPVLGIRDMDGPTMTSVPQRVRLQADATLGELVRRIMGEFGKVVKHSQVGMQEALRSGGASAGVLDTLVNVLVGNEESDDDDTRSVFKQYAGRPAWGSEYTVLEVEEASAANTTEVRLSSTMEARRLEYIRESFVKIVHLILEQPDTPLSQVTVLGDAEHSFLYSALSHRETLQVPEPEFLHAAFERYARDTPDAVAIDFNGERQISYAELNTLANRFAHELRGRHGVRTGDLIPLMLDRSVDMMVVILGVMKAGAAYVPLSPDNPAERNAFVVSDAGARLVVVHAEHEEFGRHLGAGVETLVVAPGMPDLLDDAENKQRPAIDDASPDNLAYVIYTSGSTGQPKGVKVPHRSAAAAVQSMAVVEGRYEGAPWRTLQFANYVFDASVQDFFNTLSTGGALCMAPTDVLLSDIAGCINRMDARQSIITPTVAKLFRPDDVPRFERLIVGGEPLTPDVVETWGRRCRILNVYGPTETSMVVTTMKDVRQGGRIGNIGAPFPTVMAFIVDPEAGRDSLLRPYGAVGELCIAGPQVTAGYVNRPDLTAAAYVDSEALGGVRVYRTGDLARWLPGGEIECLGRKDNQVKIHGHRIELGEVENAIRRTGLVQDVVALATSIRDKLHLVAFCVFRNSAGGDDGSDDASGPDEVEALDPTLFAGRMAELRENLGSLAAYMVPKFVVPMGVFPKLPSRKVDRKALRKVADELDPVFLTGCALDRSGGGGEGGHVVVPTETPAERALEAMWADIFSLPAEQIGREANFLALGGDSISAITLASFAREAGYSLSVPNILKTPKLKDLATAMKEIRKDAAKARVVFKMPDSVKVTAEAVGLRWEEDVEYAYPSPPGQAEFLQQGSRDEQMWVLQTVRHMPAELGQDAWVQATTALSQVNDILRTTWIQAGDALDDWVGLVLRSPRLDVARAACETDEDVTRFTEEFWESRFTFGKPFIKYAQLARPDGSWVLVIKMDHAVYDGTLLRVFDDHFAAIVNGEPVPRHGEFRTFAEHMLQADKKGDLAYWARSMAGKPAAIKAANSGDSAPIITAALRHEVATPNLERAARQLGVTPSIVFQAAFSLWLGGSAHGADVNFDYLLSGRNVALPDPQSINGTLAQFLPVRTAVDPAEPLPGFLGRVQDDFWAMTEHASVGMDAIYGAAGLARETHGNKVLFLFQPFEPAAPSEQERPRWLVMAKSKVRMFQPYELVVEVSKALGDRHVLKIMYDETCYAQGDAEKIAQDIAAIVDVMAEEESEKLFVGAF
ncbi:hypothetical protein RB601_003247 [Gaeumannomyces tritici]